MKHNIRIIDAGHPDYPHRLKHCADAPPILFYKGHAELNPARMIAIIGTRRSTEYGRRVTEQLIGELKSYDITVVSGLAKGIDALAHSQSIRCGIPTIGVLAHGLDTIYPAVHRNLAKDMLQHGALLSEYFSGTRADKSNFPTRNRIVAGMVDAVVIIETDLKGGSMITAEIAYAYNRDIYCVPGRIGDTQSRGCNLLMRSLKANMITCADDIADGLGWRKPGRQKVVQPTLFLELTPSEQLIVNLLRSNGSLHIDEFYLKTNLNSSELASTLLQLEIQQIIKILPGKLVTLIH